MGGRLVSARVGDRVRLVSTSDQHTRLLPNTEGTVVNIDSLGTLHVDWDDGSTLGLIPGEDVWQVITVCEPRAI
jgi:hypothetical protein